jgi:type II secretory pathway pseudopilin PulG
MNRSKGTRAGLTIVELLLVIVIIGFLALMLFPTRTIVDHPHSRRTQCMNNLRQIGHGLVIYANDFGDFYPTVRAAGTTDSRPLASLALVYNTYADAKSIFKCPSTTDNCQDLQPGTTFQPHGAQAPGPQRQTSYAYDDTRNVNTSSCIVIAGDAPPASPSGAGTGRLSRNSDNHGGKGQNVLYYGVDTVKWISNTMNPDVPGDDIYEASKAPSIPAVSDSCISQTRSGAGRGGAAP